METQKYYFDSFYLAIFLEQNIHKQKTYFLTLQHLSQKTAAGSRSIAHFPNVVASYT